MSKIKSVDDARNLSNTIADQSIDLGRPSFVTANPRGEPRELLRNFHFNYPFFPVAPVPRLAQLFALDATSDLDVTLPDGTLLVSFAHAGPAGYAVLISFDGKIPGAFTAQVPNPGIIINPPAEIGYLCYPNRTLTIRGSAASFLSIIPYVSSEAARIKNQ